MEGAPSKPIVLILARELASNLATPMMVIDGHGTLVFYNEPAEEMVGQPFSQTGEVDALEWGKRFDLRDLDDTPIALETLPAGVAVLERRAAHQTVKATDGTGVERVIDITAFPLFARADEFAGAVAIFWEHS